MMHLFLSLILLLTQSASVRASPLPAGPGPGPGITAADLTTSIADFLAPIPLDHLPGMFSRFPPSAAPSTTANVSTKVPTTNTAALTTAQITSITSSIRNTLALYPLAIDGKNFTALNAIFSTAAIANYSSPLNILSPLSGIQESLEKSLACVSTQHSLGTQAVDVLSDRYARSVTYYTASHFGRAEKMRGQVATAHGQYQDLWERVDPDADADENEGGEWRVVHRNLVYMSEVMGNQGVFVC